MAATPEHKLSVSSLAVIPLPLTEAAFRQVLQMQARMQPLKGELPAEQSGDAVIEKEQQHFAAAMRTTMEVQTALDNEEDALVIQARKIGMAWVDIAAMLPTRTLADLKRRFNTRMAAAQAQNNRTSLVGVAHHIRPVHSSGNHHPARFAKEGFRPRNGRKLVGDERITLLKPQPGLPQGFTGREWHKLQNLEEIRFFGAADVVDPDQEDGGELYRFELVDEAHGACFNLGEDDAGNTLISWSQLHAIYTLPDGSIWAEHSDFIDRSDMLELARKTGKDASTILSVEEADRELFKQYGRRHSKLQDVEYQCWVFRDALPNPLPEAVTSASDAFFWRTCFDPETLQPIEEPSIS